MTINPGCAGPTWSLSGSALPFYTAVVGLWGDAATYAGRRAAYLVNLMRLPVQVTLRWRTGGAWPRDLRTGAPVLTRWTLAPRQLVFAAY